MMFMQKELEKINEWLLIMLYGKNELRSFPTAIILRDLITKILSRGKRKRHEAQNLGLNTKRLNCHLKSNACSNRMVRWFEK